MSKMSLWVPKVIFPWKPSGVLQHMKQGSILVDHTTSCPQLAQRIYDQAKKLNISSYDAPVTGGDIGAKEGK